MPGPAQLRDAHRLISRDGRRHFRRRYVTAEVWWGVGVLGGLIAVAGWVAHKGAHPDPGLSLAIPQTRTVGTSDRGVLPVGLATTGWGEGPVSQFDAKNLYVKINGREGYYKSFGFRRLYFVSLVRGEGGAPVVDLELFDLGTAANALGAYAGERPAGAASQLDGGGLGHIRRNALMMTQGRYYARAIGSEEAPAVRSQLEHLRGVLSRDLQGGALPWGYAFFVGGLGFEPSKVRYLPENAFSFGFAKQIYAVPSGAADEQLFVGIQPTAEAAQSLARRFAEGFSRMGRVAFRAKGVAFVEDEYIQTLSAAAAKGQWVYGVYRAPDRASATAGLERLSVAFASLPAEVTQRAAEEASGGKPKDPAAKEGGADDE